MTFIFSIDLLTSDIEFRPKYGGTLCDAYYNIVGHPITYNPGHICTKLPEREIIIIIII